jgi:hypothetical protein
MKWLAAQTRADYEGLWGGWLARPEGSQFIVANSLPYL